MYVCVYVCLYVCVCVCVTTHNCRLTIEITKQRYRVHSNTAIVLNFADFPKNASFKRYGVICLPRAAPASFLGVFPHEKCFYASVKPIATF